MLLHTVGGTRLKVDSDVLGTFVLLVGLFNFRILALAGGDIVVIGVGAALGALAVRG